MKFLITLYAIAFVAVGCAQSQNCPDNINKLPLFGGLKKCPEQVHADEMFIKECDKHFDNRKAASVHHAKRGWGYFYQNKPDSAIMRFNQAWLLDSLNVDVYWGLGNVMGSQKKFNESLRYLSRATELDPDNPKIWQDASTTYGNLFFQTNDLKYLQKTISTLKNAIRYDRENPHLYGKLTAAYSYLAKKDSALKYLRITDKMNPKAIHPEVRTLLKADK